MRHLFPLLISLLLVFSTANSCLAQLPNGPFIYGDAALGPGYPANFRAAVQGVFLRRHVLGIGYQSFFRRDPHRPSDQQALGGFNVFAYPNQFLTGTSLTYGYLLYPAKNRPRLRLQLRGGILLGNYSTPENYQPNSKTTSTGYTYERSDHPTTAVLLNPTFEYTPSRGFGLSFGLYAMGSSQLSGAGISAGLLLGKVSNFRHDYRRPKKQH